MITNKTRNFDIYNDAYDIRILASTSTTKAPKHALKCHHKVLNVHEDRVRDEA